MFLGIGLAQTKIGYENFEEAFSDLESSFTQSGVIPKSVVVLPEMWPSGFNRKKLFHLNGQIKDFLAHLKSFAVRHNIYIAVPIPLKSLTNTEKMSNSFICVSPQGEFLSEYRKMHLFSLAHESEIFEAGNQLIFSKIEGVKVGFAVCYDLRFPELFRRYAKEGVEVVLVSACFPDPRQPDWSVLLKARAIENQYFVVGVNAAASEEIEAQSLNYFGHSAAIDPKGTELVTLGRQPGFAQVTLDISDILTWRKTINFLEDESDALKESCAKLPE